jgi:zinc transporter ZupT
MALALPASGTACKLTLHKLLPVLIAITQTLLLLRWLHLHQAFFAGVVLCGALDMLTDFILKCAAFRRRHNSSSESSTASGAGSEAAGASTVALSCDLKDVANRTTHQTHHTAGAVGVVDVLSIAAGGSGCTDEIIVDVGLQEAAAAMKTSDECQLARTSLLIALALGFHNLPEGLATFVGCVLV